MPEAGFLVMVIGPLPYIGTFAFRGTPESEGSTSKRDPRIEIREIADDVL